MQDGAGIEGAIGLPALPACPSWVPGMQTVLVSATRRGSQVTLGRNRT